MQITKLIDSQPAMMKELAQFIEKVTLAGLKELIEGKVYKMLAKLKK